MRRIIGPKTGENKSKVIAQVLRDYNIDKDNMGTFTMDNAGDNDTMMVYLYKKLEMLPERAKSSRLRCPGHIINLVVRVLLFDIL